MQDLNYALRVLRKSPGFTTVAVIALALGIGANTAIFSVVHSVLLRPLPYRDADRLVVVWEKSPQEGNRVGLSGPDFVDYRNQNRSFDQIAALEPGTGTVSGFGEPQQVPGARVTTNYLSVFGVKPMLGRDFLPGEGWNQRVVILSYASWDRYFGRDPHAIGKGLKLDGILYTVIGVLPSGFWSPIPTDLLAPWSDADLLAKHRRAHDFSVFARLKAGISVQQAASDLTEVEHRIGEQIVGLKEWGATVAPMQEVIVQNVRTGLLLLLAAVGLVLLIACANLANLMLARATGRSRETAIRVALGAVRARLVRQFLTESALLGLVGGTLGLLIALWGVDLLQTLVPQTVRLAEGAGEAVRPRIAVDTAVLLFTLLVSVITGALFGLAPAFAAARTDVHAALKEGARGSSGSSGGLRNALVVAEVALALVLVIGSGLVMKSFWRIQQVDPGFRADHVLAMEIELPTDSRYRTPIEQADFFRRLLAKVDVLPGVRSAGMVSVLPLNPGEDRASFFIDGRPPLPPGQYHVADYRTVSPDYFRTMGIPLQRGRNFGAQDQAGRPPVVVINESLARRFWPDGSDPIGHRLRIGRAGILEIIGIVSDVKGSGLDRQATATVYVSYLQAPQFRMSLVVRAAVDPSSMVQTVKGAVYSVDRDQSVYNIRTLDQLVSDSQSSSRFTLLLLGIFAAAALALSAAGIYGVISYSVAQRTREIGIRLAMGAQRSDVLRLVLRQGLILAGIGVASGLSIALAVTRIMASLLFEVSPRDPVIFPAAAAFMAVIALLATYIPARRAMNLDATISLRYE